MVGISSSVIKVLSACASGTMLVNAHFLAGSGNRSVNILRGQPRNQDQPHATTYGPKNQVLAFFSSATSELRSDAKGLAL
jgi:hypothetical protein